MLLKYIVRHDDTGAFTHGKMALAPAEYEALARLPVLRASSCGALLQAIYMAIYHELLSTYGSGAPCATCGEASSFVPAPVFDVGVDDEFPQVVLRCAVSACCLKCVFERHLRKRRFNAR